MNGVQPPLAWDAFQPVCAAIAVRRQLRHRAAHEVPLDVDGHSAGRWAGRPSVGLFGDDVNPGSDPPWLALGAMLRSGREKLGLTAPPAVLEALNEREDGGSEE